MTELFLALQRIGWAVTVCTAQPSLVLDNKENGVPRHMTYNGVEIFRVWSIGSHSGGLFKRILFASSYFLSSMFFLIGNAKKMDGIVFTTNPPFLGLLGTITKKLFRKRFLYIVYDVYPDILVNLGVISKKGFLHKVLERLSMTILANADCNVVIGRDMLEIIRDKVNISRYGRIKLIPNWSDDQMVYPVQEESNELKKELGAGFDLIVQYSGRMARTHNLEPLVEAADILKEEPILFQFIGDGAKKKALQKMVAERKLSNVRFFPYQPLEKLNEALSMADVAVVCLEKEFVGLSVPSKAYGIMAVACPILGFIDPKSEIGRVIEETGCGVVLSDPTGETVAETLMDLLKDRSRLKQMGQNGYKEFKQNYTLRIAAGRYSKAMNEIFLECR